MNARQSRKQRRLEARREKQRLLEAQGENKRVAMRHWMRNFGFCLVPEDEREALNEARKGRE